MTSSSYGGGPGGESLNAQDAQAWSGVRDALRRRYGPATFSSWFDGLRLLRVDGEVAHLTAPKRINRDWVLSEYETPLLAMWREQNPGVHKIDITVAPRSEQAEIERTPHADEASREVKGGDKVAKLPERFDIDALSTPLDDRATFENFVVGKSNELAYAAAKRVAESDVVSFNPLYLYGVSGMGKTHLMNAVAWEIRRKDPKRRVLYLSAERFMNEFINALRFRDTLSFKQQFRTLDVLMVDDVQFFGGKDSTQEEFFHTLNALIDQGRQIIISADRAPNDLSDVGVQARIRNRLGWGLTADIHTADYELRLGILRSKLALHLADNPSLDVPQKVLEFISHKIQSNARELEGALNKIVAHAIFFRGEVTLELAQELLHDHLRAHERQVTVTEIRRQTALYYKKKEADLTSARRTKDVTRPRQVAMYLAKTITTASLPEIGRHFGGRDHTTVMYAVRKVEKLIKDDRSMAEDVDVLQRLLLT
ncbi:MAG: chromosomal replication initiator protein DnaA [Pseudomonadota bacterium]